ncbi:right-handed parallel beta-helix repeat-containing protein [Solibacillus cecembensis]|uniref:right-handed parallel beta-helix repeat-containing protein n=1 Tax=Solibacillus cecembensis TaxID=459347 RepID=UPI003D043DA6
MSILQNLRQVKKELLNEKHPLAHEKIQFRKTYAIGFAMLVCVNGYPSEMAKESLKKQITLLDLPPEFKKLAISVAMEAESQTIHNVLQTLHEAQHKYIFMLDLYGYAQKDHKITEKEQELLVLFEELFQLSYEEVQFIRGFRLAMLKKDTELATKVVQTAFEQNVGVTLQELSYFLPGFEYQERLTQMTLLAGQKKKLGHATYLTGEVIVGKGAELDLNGMNITFGNEATIIVDGGVIKADGVRFIASLDANKTMLSLRNMGITKINDAHFFGANNVRAIEMNNAKVELDSCSFEKCFTEERGGAIYFTNSEHFVLRNCIFEHNSTLGKGGSMYIAGTEAKHMTSKSFFSRITGKVQKVKLVVEGCQFKESRADRSGALHMYDAEISIRDTVFDSCSSRAGGAAIDTLNCTMNASHNTFTKCRAALNEAVVVLGNTKGATEDSLGRFELCEPKNVVMK